MKHFSLAPGSRSPRLIRQSALRVAPMRDRRALASVWKIWARGDEVYLASRNRVKFSKVSLHSGGAWFVDLGDSRTTLAPPLPLSGGIWKHALELRWLVDGQTLPPPREQPVRRKDTVLYLETPKGCACTLNLLYGSRGNIDAPLPLELSAGARLQELTLRDGTPVITIARIIPFREEDIRILSEYRGENGIRANFDGEQLPKGLTVEATLVSRNYPTGNVMTIFPLGPDAVRLQMGAHAD